MNSGGGQGGIFSFAKSKAKIISPDTPKNIFNDVGRVVEDAFIDNGTSKNCHSYTLMNADTSNQDTIIVDFGDGNPADCLSYGKLRRGKIKINPIDINKTGVCLPWVSCNFFAWIRITIIAITAATIE